VQILLQFISIVFGYSFFSNFRRMKNKLVTFSILRKLSKHGDQASFEYPLKIKGFSCICIGNNFKAGSCLRMDAIEKYGNQLFTPKIVIGDHVTINPNGHLAAIGNLYIGNNVLMASNVFISDHTHGTISFSEMRLPPSARALVTKGPIVIEDDVWIGEGVCILGNVTVGKGSIIGAHAVVVKDIPPYSVAAGVPAKVIKTVYDSKDGK
jgi:acetyltransferase-like isoleucine patch superfamily enzyme